MKNGSKAVLGFFVMLFAGAVVGCSSPCSTLKDTCATCNATYKPTCDAVVSADVSDACKADQPTFDSSCK